MAQLSHPYMTGKTILWLYGPLLAKWCLCLLICCLDWSLLFFQGKISFNFVSAVIICSDLEPKKIKSVTVSIFSSSIYHEVKKLYSMIFIFWVWHVKPAFSLSSFTFIKRLFSSSSLSAIRVISSAYMRLLFILAILILACHSSSLAFQMMYSA